MKKAIENVNNQMLNTVSGEESLSPLEIAAKKYDKGAHCGQFAGEDPSYHFINGAEWQQAHSEPSGKEKSEVKGTLADKAQKHAKSVEQFYSATLEGYRLRAKNSYQAGYIEAIEETERTKDATISALQEQLMLTANEIMDTLTFDGNLEVDADEAIRIVNRLMDLQEQKGKNKLTDEATAKQALNK